MSSSEIPPEGPPSGKKVTLTLRAADRFTEIRLLDARFQPVALSANTGNVTVSVSPGLYEVGFRGVKGWETQTVFANPDMSELTVVQLASESAEAAMVSPAETEVMAARSRSKPQATVIVFLTGTASGPVDPILAAKIAVSLSRGEAGEQTVADLMPGDPSSFQFTAAPGYWRLRFSEPGDRPPFELPLTVSPRYRLEIIAPVNRSGEARIDLEQLRVRLLPLNEPGAMDAEQVGFEAAALAALASGRALYGPDFEQLVENLVETHNPMLGIFAAHLCDRGQDDDLNFQERLLERLARLTGAPAIVNPDIAVLRLRLLMRMNQSIANEPAVSFPPLLAASWEALLDAARIRPDLVPPGSLSERIAARLWSSRLWLAWSAAPAAAPPQPRVPPPLQPRAAARAANAAVDDFATRSAKIASALAYPELRDWFRSARSSSGSSPDGLGWDEMLELSPAEAAVAKVLYPVAADEKKQGRLEQLTKSTTRSGNSPIPRDLTAMSKTLGLPPATVELAIDSLATKLGSRANDFKIKLGE